MTQLDETILNELFALLTFQTVKLLFRYEEYFTNDASILFNRHREFHSSS